MKRKATIAAVIGVAIGAALIVANIVGVLSLRQSFSESHPLRFFNHTGEPLRHVQISITWDNPELHLERWFTTVQPEELIEIETGRRDWALEITYEFRSESFTLTNPYVDLWSGEAWRIVVQPDGTATESYDR